MLDQSTTTPSQTTTAPRPQQQQPRPEANLQSQSLTDSADQALKSVATLYNAVDGLLARQVQDSPYTTLAAAAAVGFMVGGGLRSPVGQLLLRLSVRTFGPPLVKVAMQSVLEQAGAGLDAGETSAGYRAVDPFSQRGERT
jgi:ElaB/YqjD/DUF883 family membrane-anchored ribosome-binding protein